MTKKVALFGMEIDAVCMSQAVDEIYGWIARPERACRYVVTPNVDHAVMFQEHSGLRAAYADASLVLADGAPVVLASRLLRRPLPQRVTVGMRQLRIAADELPGPVEGTANQIGGLAIEGGAIEGGAIEGGAIEGGIIEGGVDGRHGTRSCAAPVVTIDRVPS